MLHITPRLYADALELDTATAYRRLRPLPFTTGPRGEHFYFLITALTTTRPKERQHLAALFDAATDMPAPMPPNPERLADEFEIWLRSDPRQQPAITRLAQMRRAFGQHLADSVTSSELLKHSEYLRCILPLSDPILRWITTGQAGADWPTDMAGFAVAFAVQNFPSNNKMKEAA